jgi:hypothetical protein
MTDLRDDDDRESKVRRGRRAPFKQLPDDVLDDETISPEAKVVYWYLKRIADYDDDTARVSMGRIAEKLGRARTNRRAARGWVTELVTAGWVDAIERRSAAGADLAADYIVHETRGSTVPQGGDRWRPRGRGENDPHSSRSVFTQDVSSSKNEEDPHGSSSSEAPHGDPDLLGDLLVLSKARGERQPRTNSRSSTTEVAQEPGTSGNGSAARRDQPGERGDVEELCQRLRVGIIRNGSKPPTVSQEWRQAARLLLDKDSRDLTKALNLIDWCQEHHFWKSTILSMPTFRTQYDKLRLQALDEYQRSNERAQAGDRWGSGPHKQRNPVDQSVYDVDPFQQAAQEQATRVKVGAS